LIPPPRFWDANRVSFLTPAYPNALMQLKDDNGKSTMPQ